MTKTPEVEAAEKIAYSTSCDYRRDPQAVFEYGVACALAGIEWERNRVASKPKDPHGRGKWTET